MKTKMLLLIPILWISGCASLGGNAFYKYEKVGADCRVTIDSGRVLKSGAELEIEGCNIKVRANSLEQGGSSVADVNVLIATVANLLLKGQNNDSARSDRSTAAEVEGTRSE